MGTSNVDQKEKKRKWVRRSNGWEWPTKEEEDGRRRQDQ